METTCVVAICTDSYRSGCAVYSDSIVKLIADRRDQSDPFKGLDLVIQRFAPHVVIVSSVQKKLIEFLERQARSFTLVIVPNIWFCMSKGFQKLIDSDMVRSRGCLSQEEKIFFVSTKVKKSVDVCAIRSIAAINEYIEHTSIGGNIPARADTNEEPSVVVINRNQPNNDIREAERLNLMSIIDARYVDPGPILSIDRLSLEALGIFSNSNLKYRENSNLTSDLIEIPSLYELLNLCKSTQGKAHLHTMMLWPLQDYDELRFRHDAVEFFMTPEGNLLRDQLLIQMKNVVPLAGLVAKLSQSVACHRDITQIYRALWSFVSMIDLIKSTDCYNLEILSRITNTDSDDLREIVTSMVNMIDFEASKKERRVQLCPGVDQTVDEKKELIENLPTFCDEVALEETRKYRDIMGKQFRVLYVPRIGFLNSVDYLSSSELARIRSIKDFEVLLHTEQAVYFKTPRMEELDLNAGDVACDLIDVQEEALLKLQNSLLRQTENMLKLTELFGELDCLIAFATVSQQRSYTRPEFIFTEDGIHIHQAYHPLQSIRVNIVPNDVKFYSDAAQRKAKVMIITGPNSCGKTTYMKAIGLIVYMAHIGCFVPATKARLPVMDAILTRLNSTNSVSTGLSSFASDLYQVNYAINHSTERSLIIIDEFGRGTLARDGFALLIGLVTYFACRIQRSPYVVVSTHFNHLIDHVQNYSEYILYKTFRVTRNSVNNDINYEYKLIDGVGETSLADKVAEKAGIPSFIIERANQIRGYISEGSRIHSRPPRGA